MSEVEKYKWADVEVGDSVYVIEYSWKMLLFNGVEVPSTYAARVDAIEGSREDFSKHKLVTFYCIRTDNGQKFKFHINGLLTSYRGIEIEGEYCRSNDSDSIIAVFKNFVGEDIDHYATMNRGLYEKMLVDVRTKARDIAKNKMNIIREQLKVINSNLKIK